MNIMQDGFSFVYTFRQDYDISYFSVHFYWYYYDSTINEFYGYFLPAVNCTTDHYSEDILARLYNYNIGSGVL